MCQSHKKKANQNYNEATTRSKGLLQVMHTYIGGTFLTTCISGGWYFIKFTDDFSRYTYVYFSKDRTEALHYFKVFKGEVENQVDKRVFQRW